MATDLWPAFKKRKMKKSILLIFLAFISQFGFSNPNYKNENGTIITLSEENGIRTTTHKCIINNIKIGDLLEEKNLTIYENYTFNKIIGKLKYNDNVNVLEVCTIEYLNKPKNKWGDSAGELWYKIQLNDFIGCICKSSNSLGENTDPYYDNRYEILEEIQTSREWTVRKIKQMVSVWERLNVRETPGLDGKKVFMLHDFDYYNGSGLNPQENHEILAITEETETIDGLTDHWLKIEYKPGKYGWIFGGYASVERGGPKYYIPENIVVFDLSWY